MRRRWDHRQVRSTRPTPNVANRPAEASTQTKQIQQLTTANERGIFLLEPENSVVLEKVEYRMAGIRSSLFAVWRTSALRYAGAGARETRLRLPLPAFFEMDAKRRIKHQQNELCVLAGTHVHRIFVSRRYGKQ